MPTTTTRVNHPFFASVWPLLSRVMGRGGMDEHRKALLAGLSGNVVEIGAGHGVMFAHYPPAVTRVLAVEPEPHLRRRAAEAAARAPVPVEVVDAVADRLPATDQSMDAAVFALVLCSVPDPAAALAEARRVLKPGGELRFLEHGRADTPGLVRVQQVMDATFWPRLAGGCHTGRDIVAEVQRAGFAIRTLERYRFPFGGTPFSFHMRGTATRP
ncbi:class I SAM-dependent methyltransferase [Nonomuraea terrae]|uniref:class I SAM-dependent methyltransferase n=1 Tax=Nonomuraea terrae TaxID=2530383 RepID=UPI0037AF64E0